MTEFLVKKFVKDSENIESTQVRTRYGILSSIVGILCNVFLFSVKLTIGILLSSLAVTADAFNNLSDAASSIISFVGVKMAGKPADAEHPFGHGRIEYVAALIVAFLVIQVGLTFLKSSVTKIIHPEEISFELIPFVILILSILVKLWMAFFNKKLGKRIDSKVMLATAADSLGDVVTTGATVLSILICHFTSVNVDAIAGLIVSIIVIWSGISIARDTLEPLIGQRVPTELYQKITKLVDSHEGILGSHDLIVHNYGPTQKMASIHAEVPNDMSIEQAHTIIDHIERQAEKELNILLVIHMDPVEMHDEEILTLQEKVKHLIHALDENLKFHDFRVIKEEEKRILLFDLVVPDSYSHSDADRTMQQLMHLIHEENNQTDCIITLDRNFEAPEK
ncbi:MAG: cation diffusion facilitator family transporter [Eubacterium sp.]|nr:cation diffusion facilitator family transporter [Eubacterium sp.]MDD7209321.1 cation diffusion facilitator family transporter [Lachnospiraceae bacterium]MDY5498141.1 cation diffusion facilitator family transporter [Anaerobutyricum sp.]